MNPLALLSLAIAAIALMVTLYKTVFYRDDRVAAAAERLTKIEERVSILWSVLFRKMVSDAVATGILEARSPLHLNVQVLKQHEELVQRVRVFYEVTGKDLSDEDLAMQLEIRFGQELAQVAVEHKLRGGELMAMLFLVRPKASFFAPFDTTGWKKDVAER